MCEVPNVGREFTRREFLSYACAGFAFLSPFLREQLSSNLDPELCRAVNGLPPEMAIEGPVEPNSQEYLSLNCQRILTVNLVDGTTTGYIKSENHNTEWLMHPIGDYGIVYAIIGRELSANPSLTDLYSRSSNPPPGSRYDGNYGIYYSQNEVPRTTYTPPLVARVKSPGLYVENFGGIGGRTDISVIRRLFRDNDNRIVEHNLNSQYTIHRVPENTPDQSFLLRQVLLENANRTGVPLQYPDMHRSSGCVNYDSRTWRLLKNFLEAESTLVVFTYPSLPQDLLFLEDPVYANDPFRYGLVEEEGYWYNQVINRRGYFNPQGNT